MLDCSALLKVWSHDLDWWACLLHALMICNDSDPSATDNWRVGKGLSGGDSFNFLHQLES